MQDQLIQNKKDFDIERLREFKERKRMETEDRDQMELRLMESSKKEMELMEEEAREAMMEELDLKWKKHLVEQEVDRQALIQQLIEGAAFRMKTKKGKKKGKKPKK